MKYPLLSFTQPAGTFYLTVLPAKFVAEISYADPRRYDPSRHESLGGVQRLLSARRVKEIASYAATVDAAFPTAVILALAEGSYSLASGAESIEFISTPPFANLVDGQHRLEGLKASEEADEFDLPVVLLLDSTLEQQALLIATINGKQTKVESSLIYDLFGLTETRSPWRTAHEIARAMNRATESPFHNRLKMLGRKSIKTGKESITQGTFVRELLAHMSSDPESDFGAIRSGKEPIPDPSKVFSEFFCRDEDSTIIRILQNLFSAQRRVWPREWADPAKSILRRSTGFMATMWALDTLVRCGKESKDLSRSFFEFVFARARDQLELEGKKLDSDSFPSSGGQGIRPLQKVFEAAARQQREG